MIEDPNHKDSFGELLFFGLLSTVIFFFGTYITSTIISEVMGRQGLPGSPILYAVITYPLSVLVVPSEGRFEKMPHWSKIEPYWFYSIATLFSGVPIVLTIFTPLLFWQSLPRGGAVGVVIVVEIAVVMAVLLRGWYARRRNNP